METSSGCASISFIVTATGTLSRLNRKTEGVTRRSFLGKDAGAKVAPHFFNSALSKTGSANYVGMRANLANRRGEFTTLVFVTSRTARGVDVDSLIKSGDPAGIRLDARRLFQGNLLRLVIGRGNIPI